MPRRFNYNPKDPKEKDANVRARLRLGKHGTEVQYHCGCRCNFCKDQASPNPRLVDATLARQHLHQLSRKGVGYLSVHEAIDVGSTTLHLIRMGYKEHIPKAMANKILNCDVEARAGGSLVPSGPAWDTVTRLVADGYTMKQLSKWLGLHQLQLRRKSITLTTQTKIERLAHLIKIGKLRRPAD